MADSELEQARKEAFEAGERMRLVIASIRDYAIFILDVEGKVASWNPGAELAKGYRADEIIGRHFEAFYTPEDRERNLPRQLLGAAVRDGRVENEGWRVRKDGSTFWADVIITALRDSSGTLVGFAKVTRDLTERRRADDERLRLARAEEAVNLRDEFLSIAAHELKTPLTALKMQVDTLLAQTDLDEKLAKKVTRAARSTEQLDRLIDSLMDVSRIATGHLTLAPQKTNLTEVMEQLMDVLRAPAEKADCALSLIAGGPLFGCWDQMRVEQVVMNLVSNAIRYAAGTPITVSLSRERDEARIDVSDGGPGLPEKDRQRIFERFERAASPRHYGGMGLGLYVSREIVEAHGGTITARNLSSGGALFTVRLPLEPLVARAENAEIN